ncbi:MAG: chorismate-binding protein [Muribaculaceae bacterium]|nr:chorismate-binding protein [Muribaculaceae bacterium]
MDVIAYRLPGAQEKWIFRAERSDGSLSAPGANDFAISPFADIEGMALYSLVEPFPSIPADVLKRNLKTYDFKELSRPEYFSYIEEIKRNLEGSPGKKVVASRRLKVEIPIDADKAFRDLCTAYPDAFVFFISTREFGSWIGASPELLLKSDGARLSSVALAGTRLVSPQQTPWDTKNKLEQAIVTAHIEEAFRNAGLSPQVGSPTTLQAGKIEHIKTDISASVSPDLNLAELLRDLAPTPALAGHPRTLALELIQRHEGPRALYGGFLGPVSHRDFNFYVALRCAFLTPTEAALFAGGGITAQSAPEAEWEETNNKFQTLLSILSP